MSNWDVMSTNKAFESAQEPWAFDHLAADRIRPIEHDHAQADRIGSFEAIKHRGLKGVVTRPDVLEID
jgi:hypothetical protein